MKIRKIIVVLLASSSLFVFSQARADAVGKLLKNSVLVAGGVGVAIVYSSKVDIKKLNLKFNDPNKASESLFETLSDVDLNKISLTDRNEILNTINKLLKNDKLTVVNRDSLEIIKNKINASKNILSENEKYIEKPNPYLKGQEIVENNRELPISEIKNPYLITNPYGDTIDTSTEFPLNPPKSYEEYLTLKQDSTILAKNLGGARKGYAAHHIVPASDKNAQDARDILKKHGIDINDAVNGVFLPTDISNSNGEIVHKGRHPVTYSESVSRLVNSADKKGGKSEVEKILVKMRSELQNNKSDWNSVFNKIKV